MKKHVPLLKGIRKDQSGINMVDLMMWLVIAALLLAAAIQGIGYYQKNAYLYQMKSDALHAAETVTAKVANTDGKFTHGTISAGVSDSTKTADVTLAAEPGSSDAAGYVLRSTHPNVDDKDVVFLSKQRGTYAPGVHVVPKGTVIEGDGSTVVTPPDGGDDSGGDTGGGDGGATYTPIANNDANPVDAVYMNRMNTEIAAFATPEYRTFWVNAIATDWSDEEALNRDWVAYASTPAGEAYEASPNFTHLQQATYNSMTQQTAGGVNTLFYAAQDAQTAFETTPNEETHQAWITAQENLFEAVVANPLPDGLTLVAAPGYAANFGTITVAAGSSTDATVRYALPNSVATYAEVSGNGSNWSVRTFAPTGFDGYGSSFSGVVQNASGTAYWEGVVHAPSGGWTVGTHTVTAIVFDNTTKYNYISEITIRVQ